MLLDPDIYPTSDCQSDYVGSLRRSRPCAKYVPKRLHGHQQADAAQSSFRTGLEGSAMGWRVSSRGFAWCSRL